MPNKSNFKVTFGGWYQRTTLHLSEIYNLLELGKSKLRLNKKKLKDFQILLDLKEVTREAESLEYVKAITNTGIEIRFFEDGLFIFETTTNDINSGQRLLKQYFNNVFNPATSYIFSLGAPTPKILANIEAVHPIVVSISTKKPDSYKVNANKYGEVYSNILSNKIGVYKTPKHIFVVSSKGEEKNVSDLVEMQIFFREFKDQLEKYLDIHRNIWEEISEIKERKFIKGNDVGEIREKLESYKKTVDLIRSRINQMEAYIKTRQSISKDLKIETHLNSLFQYKFDILSNTHSYITDIWNMTSDYINSAIQIVVELENKATNVSIKTLQLITSVGVVSGVLGYLAGNKIPKVTKTGLIYFFLLLVATLLINWIISKYYRNLKYKLKFTKRARKI